MLQEITISSEQLTLMVQKYGYKAESNIDITNHTTLGTGFVWKANLPVSNVYSVVECRTQLLKLGDYNFVNIYAPSGTQNKQARRTLFGQDIFRLVRGFDQSIPILGGDFNCILSPSDTERNFSDKKCPALKALVDNFDYKDAYTCLNPRGSEFSFCRPNCAASRLDRFYTPSSLQHCVKSVSYHASLSDHKYVIMQIKLPSSVKNSETPKSKSPYWKLNTAILKDEDFLDNFSVMYSKLQEYTDIFFGGTCVQNLQ